jgi:hypothetical protein
MTNHSGTDRDFAIDDHIELATARRELLGHSIYERVNNEESLRAFMTAHVFAVWDFMSLAKRLQRELTCVTLPWMPPKHPESARLINEIILGEESDLGPDGTPLSHLDLYLDAMREVGADVEAFALFRRLIESGVSPQEALLRAGAPGHVQTFVATTLHIAFNGSLEEVLAYFFFGREDVIPDMFGRLLTSLPQQANLTSFTHYLRRHIELDGDEHGPAARRILATHMQGEAAQRRVADAAAAAVRARIELFSGIENALPQGRPGRAVREEAVGHQFAS